MQQNHPDQQTVVERRSALCAVSADAHTAGHTPCCLQSLEVCHSAVLINNVILSLESTAGGGDLLTRCSLLSKHYMRVLVCVLQRSEKDICIYVLLLHLNGCD